MSVSKTRGIVLNQLKYSETSVIINVLTEEYGKMSFIVNGVRKKKSKIPASYFQAFNILQISYYHSSKSDLHRVLEVSNDVLLQNIIFDISKSSICMFLAEFVNISLQAQEQDRRLFDFLESLIQYIDQVNVNQSKNVHLWTLLRLMQFNGINPENNYSIVNCYFNPIKGSFVNNSIENSQVFDKQYSSHLHALLTSSIDNSYKVEISRAQRNTLMSKLIDYFKVHIDGFRTTKSLGILIEVFD